MSISHQLVMMWVFLVGLWVGDGGFLVVGVGWQLSRLRV
jgi:hypothetical protein